jgi:hypothetical protein
MATDRGRARQIAVGKSWAKPRRDGRDSGQEAPLSSAKNGVIAPKTSTGRYRGGRGKGAPGGLRTRRSGGRVPSGVPSKAWEIKAKAKGPHGQSVGFNVVAGVERVDDLRQLRVGLLLVAAKGFRRGRPLPGGRILDLPFQRPRALGTLTDKPAYRLSPTIPPSRRPPGAWRFPTGLRAIDA